MSFSRNARRVWLAGALLVAAVLCQGQMCASTSPVFEIVGSPDASLDGIYSLSLTTSGGTTDTSVTLAGGIPTTLGSEDSLSILDGAAHDNPKKEGTTYTGTKDAGREGSSFTMKIVITYSMPGEVPSSITQTMTFTGTIDANGVITGEGSQTIAASGYADNVADYTFTMTKQ